jgi:hypothetical protein
MELGTGYPGYNSLMPKSAGTFAEVLKQNGYSTAWYGKNHNVPDWHSSQAGPFDLWPTGLGFEYFYGFLGGDTSQWAPALRPAPHSSQKLGAIALESTGTLSCVIACGKFAVKGIACGFIDVSASGSLRYALGDMRHNYIGSRKRFGACSQRPHCTSAAFRPLIIHQYESARQQARELANTPEFATAQR